MLVFPRRIKHALDVTVQCPHDADARHDGRAVIGNQEHRFDRRLPLRELLFGFWIYLAASSRVTSRRPRGSGMGSSNLGWREDTYGGQALKCHSRDWAQRYPFNVKWFTNVRWFTYAF
jgi:hypothetical protein